MDRLSKIKLELFWNIHAAKEMPGTNQNVYFRNHVVKLIVRM